MSVVFWGTFAREATWAHPNVLLSGCLASKFDGMLIACCATCNHLWLSPRTYTLKAPYTESTHPKALIGKGQSVLEYAIRNLQWSLNHSLRHLVLGFCFAPPPLPPAPHLPPTSALRCAFCPPPPPPPGSHRLNPARTTLNHLEPRTLNPPERLTRNTKPTTHGGGGGGVCGCWCLQTLNSPVRPKKTPPQTLKTLLSPVIPTKTLSP